MDNFSSVMFNGEQVDRVVLNGQEVWRVSNNIPENFTPYTVGLLSDIHIYTGTDSTQSQADFERALSYYEAQEPMMVLAAGDLTVTGTDTEFAKYTEIRDTSSIPFFETTGNHEASGYYTYPYKSKVGDENCIAYHFYNLVGKDFCYYLKGDKYVGWRLSLGDDGVPHGETVEYASGVTIPDGDVYVFVGVLGDANNGLFFEQEMQWLKDTLEANRNRRCFVIEHCRADRLRYDSAQGTWVEDRYANYVSGNYGGVYRKPLWGQADNRQDGKNARCFEQLMSHYTNCIWLHGHSHMSAKTAVALGEHGVTPYLYDTYFGDAYSVSDFDASTDNTKYSYSVHISSCAEPRNEGVDNSAGSEGCLMLVGVNDITIKYIDFTTNAVLVEYNISTSRDTIPAGTFTTDTGLVT